MEVFTEFLGLSLNQTFLFIAAILVVVDFFMPNDLSTHIAYILLCALLAINVDAHILVKILCSLLAWFVLVAFHYYFWKAVVQNVVDRVIAPDRFSPGAAGLIGSQGTIHVLDGNKMVKVKGDLWPCVGAEVFADGASIQVVSQQNGELKVELTERK